MLHYHMSRVTRKPDFAYAKTKAQISFAVTYAKTKAQISFAVTAKLISAFVFATRIVHFLFLLNPKFQASMLLLGLYMSVCVRPDWKQRRPVFSRRGSLTFNFEMMFNHIFNG